jgi:hypothetical protein
LATTFDLNRFLLMGIWIPWVARAAEEYSEMRGHSLGRGEERPPSETQHHFFDFSVRHECMHTEITLATSSAWLVAGGWREGAWGGADV